MLAGSGEVVANVEILIPVWKVHCTLSCVSKPSIKYVP